jgi:hypothetical protein
MLCTQGDSVLSDLRNDGLFRHPELDSGPQGLCCVLSVRHPELDSGSQGLCCVLREIPY